MESIKITSDVLVDVDGTGAVSGIELLNASARLIARDGGKLIVEGAERVGAELDVG